MIRRNILPRNVDGVRTYAVTSGQGTMSASSVSACCARHRASDRAVRTCPSAIDRNRWATVESMARMHERRSDCHCSVNARAPAAVRAPAEALGFGSDRTWSRLGSSGSMMAQSPKFDTTLARDELAFITTHLSLNPCPPPAPSVPANARLPRNRAVYCRWVVTTRGAKLTCIKPDARSPTRRGSPAKSRQSITTSVYTLQGVSREGATVVSEKSGLRQTKSLEISAYGYETSVAGRIRAVVPSPFEIPLGSG